MRKLLAAIALVAVAGHARSSHAEVLETVPAPTTYGFAAAALMKDGRVLITGGGSSIANSTAEAFDPAKKTWTAVASMSEPREDHQAIALPNGKVLVVGGTATKAGTFLTTAELYDPTTDTWAAAGTVPVSTYTVSTLLTDGRVALLESSKSVLRLFDPAASAWSDGPSASLAHYQQYAAPLADGGLFVASVSGAEQYQPTVGWKPLSSPPDLRQLAGTTMLPDGRVLIVGGAADSKGGAPLVFDPIADSWKVLEGQRRGPGTLALRLTDGRVLIAGGAALDTPTADLELFNAKTLNVTPLGAKLDFVSLVATPLADGRALLIDTHYGRAYIVTPPVGCSAASECSSGFCVDGFCCDQACNGQCEACDVGPNIGTCSGVRGQPHGARTQCSPSWTPACRATICDPTRSRSSCVAPVFPPPCDCTQDSECPSGHCADGVCCNTACEGQCEACDLPGARGTCIPVTGEPRGIRKGCPVSGRGICSVSACNGVEPKSCGFIHGAETVCDSICGGRLPRHCNGTGICGLPDEAQCPGTNCSIPSTAPSTPPRFFDAVLVVALGALIERVRRARR